MTLAALSRAITAPDADVLQAIHRNHVSLAIWERTAPPSIAALSLDKVANIRFQSPVAELPCRLETAMADGGYEQSISRDALIADIAVVAEHFAAVMELSDVEIRLEHVVTNACRKFHGDYVTARLICTYVGPGTQWLDPEDPGNCDCGDPHDIRQLGSGDIGLFKGHLWSAEAPAIHRSPPIEGSGEERLVLVINPPSPLTPQS